MLMLHERVAALKTRYSDGDKALQVNIPKGRELTLRNCRGQADLIPIFAEVC